jgi:hypothetical protein
VVGNVLPIGDGGCKGVQPPQISCGVVIGWRPTSRENRVEERLIDDGRRDTVP